MRPFIVVAICFVLAFATARSQIAKSYHLSDTGTSSSLPPSNSASDILAERDTVWFGTDRGLSRTTDGGTSFLNFANHPPFDSKGTSAIAINDQEIWVAVAGSFTQDNQSLPQGGGLDYSTDLGLTWTYVPQPVDSGLIDTVQYGINRIRALAVTTTVNNITYDIALTRSTVWIASFAGMLRKSTDRGSTWQLVVLPPDSVLDSISPSDTLHFDLSPSSGNAGLTGNLNHRVFSVFASDDTTIWVGTAGGINRSTDGGSSWRKFSHQNETQPISGNFVVAINVQRWRGQEIVWAATVNAEGLDEQRGVSCSFDMGESWKTSLLGEFAHNISFHDSLVYVATDNGLFRSSDFGTTWMKTGSIIDNKNLQRFASNEIYAVASQGDTIWAAGPDGITYTLDSPGSAFGTQWNIFRTYSPVGTSARTYAYPVPFSPNQGVVRIHYSLHGQDAPVTIRIYDFAMLPVRTLLRNAVRPADTELDEIWDGTDGHNRRVANGVYFYSVEIGSTSPSWGKILVVQ